MPQKLDQGKKQQRTAPPKKARPIEINYYEWRLTAWYGSAAREELDGTGRGVYRELLDTCYGQGGFRYNPELLAKRCAVSLEVFDEIWPRIKRHFRVSKKDFSWLENKNANLFRREYFKYVKEQRNRRKKGIQKSNEGNALETTGSTSDTDMSQHCQTTGSTNTTQHNTTQCNNPTLLFPSPPETPPEQETEPDLLLENFDFGSGNAFEWFCGQFRGEIPSDLWQRFPGYVNTPEKLRALRFNVPLWMQTPKFLGGYGMDADKFLGKGYYLRKPPESTRDPPKAETNSSPDPRYIL
jgi:hypothetical protein